jgi:HSP20 family molecular chaperone IbpA
MPDPSAPSARCSEVVLPADVDEESVDARLHDGVLTVRVAKRAADKHHVEIQ